MLASEVIAELPWASQGAWTAAQAADVLREGA